MIPRPKPNLLFRGMGMSAPDTMPPPPPGKPCPVALRPFIDKLAELQEHVEAQIQKTLGELQVENDALRQRLSESLDGSSLPVACNPLPDDESWDTSSADWSNIESSGNAIIEDCRLPVGTYVYVNGLKSRPELNGEHGTLLEFDEETGRWHVIMRDGTGLSLKPENIIAEEMVHKSYLNQLLKHCRNRQPAAELVKQKALDDGIAQTSPPVVSPKVAPFDRPKQLYRDNLLPAGETNVPSSLSPQHMPMPRSGSGRISLMSLTGPGGHEYGHDNMKRSSLDSGLFADPNAMKEKVREAIYRKPYNVTDFYYETGCAQRIARSAWFDQFTLGVITLNAVWIGIDTEFNHSSTLVEAQAVFVVFDNVFCAWFFIEWLVRFCAFRRKLNGLRDRWFVFDSALAFFMVLETWVLTLFLLFDDATLRVGGGGAGTERGIGNASILRLMRLLRLTRMARMARLLRAMPELMILVKALSAAFRSVFFTIVLLMLLIYVFAVAFVQLTADTHIGQEYFPGVPTAIYKLLVAGNLPDHEIFVTAVASESVILGACVLGFIFLGPLAIMGMLAGVLVEVVGVVSSVERERMIVNHVTGKLHKMLAEMDLDGNEKLTLEEFQYFLVKPDAARMMASVGVDVVGLAEYCDFLFADAPELTFTNFVDLVLELRGTNQATVKDVVDTRKFMRQELSRLVVNELAGLEKRILAKVPQATAILVSRT